MRARAVAVLLTFLLSFALRSDLQPHCGPDGASAAHVGHELGQATGHDEHTSGHESSRPADGTTDCPHCPVALCGHTSACGAPPLAVLTSHGTSPTYLATALAEPREPGAPRSTVADPPTRPPRLLL